MTVDQLIGHLEAMRLQGHGNAQVFISDEDEMIVKSIKSKVQFDAHPNEPKFNGVFLETDYQVRR